jgi:hypothetical protein
MLSAARVSTMRDSAAGRSVTARAGELHLHQVGGGGDGADPDAQPADLQLGVAVEGVDDADPLEHPVADDLDGAARQDLLGRLEDQPDPAGEPVGVLGEGEPGAEQHGGVHVVAAGMADPRDRRPVGDVLLVLQRQGVDVGPQRDDRPVAVADVADEPRADRQQSGPQPDGLQAAGDQRGRLTLRLAELRVRVEVAAEVDELGVVGGEKGGKVEAHDRAGFGVGVRRSVRSSVTRLSTTSAMVPPAATTSRWRM